MSGMLERYATPVFDTLWYFAAERQRMFFRRLQGQPSPWSNDPILQKYKFTNAYRASDRVSQYLIRQVIYAGSQEPEDLFFRIMLFKMFNRISTWQKLEGELGEVRYATFPFDRAEQLLRALREGGERIYNAAYIMPPVGKSGEAKHLGHLRLLQSMMRDDLPKKVQSAPSLEVVYSLLRSYRMVGDFLAYQWTIDLNYSVLINFSEMDFVVPGPGAKRGLRKCFTRHQGVDDAQLIRIVAADQAREFERRGIPFDSLWGRPLQLIDCQNLFCEIDKYTRVDGQSLPHHSARPKQVFNPDPLPMSYWYPPKWELQDAMSASMNVPPAGR